MEITAKYLVGNSLNDSFRQSRASISQDKNTENWDNIIIVSLDMEAQVHIIFYNCAAVMIVIVIT